MTDTTTAAMNSLAKATADKLTQEEEERAKELLETRAEKELSHMQGSVADRAALLRAIEGIEDDEQRKAALAALKLPEGLTTEKALSGSANAELDAMAKAYQAAHTGVTVEAATAAVLRTSEGAAIYAKTLN